MSYEIINKELRIAACSVYDLKREHIYELSSKENKTLNSFTAFYLKDEDCTVINKNWNPFKEIMKACNNYVEINENGYPFLKESILRANLSNLDEVMYFINQTIDFRIQAIEKRKAKNILSILDKQPCRILYEKYISRELHDCIADTESKVKLHNRLFNLGYIQGKRAERARRKAKNN